jgi:hypothetical protein
MNRIPKLSTLLGLLAIGYAIPGARVFPGDATADFKAVGILGTGSGKDFKQLGSGVAIAPNWVIGVAHVGGKVFIQEGKEYPIDKKVFHKVDKGESADLALYHLTKPVPIHADILAKQVKKPDGASGPKVYIVGYGKTAKLRADGNGWEPIEGSQGKRRVAMNTIDMAKENRMNFGTADQPKWKTSACVLYDLDKPGDSATNFCGGGAIEHEGGMADKDSGCGWFVEQAGQMKLVAVGESVARTNTTQLTSYCYGSVGLGVYLPAYADWISAQMKG